MKKVSLAILLIIFSCKASAQIVINLDSLTYYDNQQLKYLNKGKKEAASYFKTGKQKFMLRGTKYLTMALAYSDLWKAYYDKIKNIERDLKAKQILNTQQ